MLRLALPGKPHTFAELADLVPAAFVRLDQQCGDLLVEGVTIRWDGCVDGAHHVVLLHGMKRLARWYPLGDDGVWSRFRCGIASKPRRPRVRAFDPLSDAYNQAPDVA